MHNHAALFQSYDIAYGMLTDDNEPKAPTFYCGAGVHAGAHDTTGRKLGLYFETLPSGDAKDTEPADVSQGAPFHIADCIFESSGQPITSLRRQAAAMFRKYWKDLSGFRAFTLTDLKRQIK